MTGLVADMPSIRFITSLRSGARRARLTLGPRFRPAEVDPAREAISDDFDAAWYLAQMPNPEAAEIDPIAHYLQVGALGDLDPHPLFASSWYLAENPEVGRSGMNPFQHYLEVGWSQGRDPNPLFDSDWYLSMYPDVSAAGMNPMLHYARSGATEGRDPSPLFATAWYSAAVPVVTRRGMNPLAHYLHEGEGQGYPPCALALATSFPTPPTALAREMRNSVEVTPPERADVTILIPVHGAWHWTERCLRALARTEAPASAQVMVVDDASPDDTAHRLRSFPWVDVVSAEQNLGFVGAVNLGLDRVTGPHVLLLNNDTEPQPGFLNAMLRRLRSSDDVGLVGARLVYPDGALQDAGSIIWRNGDGWNYGRFGSPDDPRYLHAREVDYCTGAALLVRRSLLDRLGGLDERYRPAYYEDTDLAFAARDLGFRVVYEPEAVVVHHEGGTHGKDETSGGKAHQLVHREVFRAKWRSELRQQVTRQEVPLVIAGSRGLKPLVVFVDHQPTTPDMDSGSYRSAQLMRIAQDLGYNVVFAALHGWTTRDPNVRRMRWAGILVIQDKAALAALLRESSDWVEAVFLARVDVAWEWFKTVRRSGRDVPVIFDTVDLHHLREQQEAELYDDALGRARADVTGQLELAMVAKSDATVVVSCSEEAYLQHLLPQADIGVLSNIHELAGGSPGWAERRGQLFVGNFIHPPNVDGLNWFLREVWPLLPPSVRADGLDVVGGSVPPDIAARASKDVRVHGWVPNLEPFLRAARLSVAPLRYGAGVKGKVGEAWAYGLPVVGTSAAMDGMYAQHDPVGVIGDDPVVLAERIAHVYQVEESWGRAREAARNRVAEHFSVERARAEMAALLARLSERRPHPTRTEDLRNRRLTPAMLREPHRGA